MISLFVAFDWRGKDGSGMANTYIGVERLDKANVQAMPETIMRNNPGQFNLVVVTNIVRLDGEWE